MAARSHRNWILDFLRVVSYVRHSWGKLRSHALDLKDVFREFHAEMWRSAAADLAVELVTYPDGFYRASCCDRAVWIQDHLVQCDSHVILQLARNKPLVSRVLAQHGIPVASFCEFRVNNMTPAKDFLRTQAGPCVVKPAIDSAGGKGVTTHVQTPRELIRAAIFASAFSPTVMIEQQIPGDVYRLLFLDGVLLDAIRRRPPHVTGDGRSTISELIRAENRRRVEQAGRTSLKILVLDRDCRATLHRAGLSPRSVLEAGRVVEVKTTTNESAAQECESVRWLVGETLVKECARAAELLGIRLAGVDVITNDTGRSLKESGGMILEMNACPGLHYHYQVSNPDGSVRVAVPILKRLLKLDQHP